MDQEFVKNWVTVPRGKSEQALKWAKQFSAYITNDYAVLGGRTEHYEKGNDYDNFDYFWNVCDRMYEFEKLFGIK